MRREIQDICKQEKLDCNKNKPIKILGISTSYRSKYACAREDPTSLKLLKIALKTAEKNGAETKLIDLRFLKIGACKECYSTCPAHCRFNEKNNTCDCYPNKEHTIYNENDYFSLEEGYDKLSKTEFLKIIRDKNSYDSGDDMHRIYKAIRESDGIIFSGFTNYYSRPALMQLMISRFRALDGGVEKLWGDGKNLDNSIKYAKNPKNKYKRRLYGKYTAFINSSKEGDSVTPDLMKACSSMGMKIIPFGTAYHTTWYDDDTFRSDQKKASKDKFTINLTKNIGKRIVEEIKKSNRVYGMYSKVV